MRAARGSAHEARDVPVSTAEVRSQPPAPAPARHADPPTQPGIHERLGEVCEAFQATQRRGGLSISPRNLETLRELTAAHGPDVVLAAISEMAEVAEQPCTR